MKHVCLVAQASHDAHGTILDGIEDRLTSHEIKSAASLVSALNGTQALMASADPSPREPVRAVPAELAYPNLKGSN